jgi:hypothetical protein
MIEWERSTPGMAFTAGKAPFRLSLQFLSCWARENPETLQEAVAACHERTGS